MSALPLPPDRPRSGPTPGGLLRFVVAMLVTLLLLAVVVVGMAYWMCATSPNTYKGPEQLTYPEHRPFR